MLNYTVLFIGVVTSAVLLKIGITLLRLPKQKVEQLRQAMKNPYHPDSQPFVKLSFRFEKRKKILMVKTSPTDEAIEELFRG